jgi:2-dehydro-3-deoxygalactonokinase
VSQAILLCDWGTSRLRAWVVRDGEVLRRQAFDLGVSTLGPGDAPARFADTVVPALDAAGLPALLCGMAGSEMGWRVVPHLACPAGLVDIAGALAPVAEGVWIAPGLTLGAGAARHDVMRGEETQVLGWQAQAGGAGERLVCLPGTHSKWVRLQDGRVIDFFTAMTGEMFQRLRTGGSLARGDQQWSQDAFNAGADLAGQGGGLSCDLFQVRAQVVAGRLAAEHAGAFLSGLLIGAEIEGAGRRLPGLHGTTVTLIGEPALTGLYGGLLARRGRTVQAVDGEAAALAGLTRLAERLA